MDDKRNLPTEIEAIFERLRSEIIWLHGRWIVFEQLYATSPERISLLNDSAPSYFRIIQQVLLTDIVIYIGRLTNEPKMGRNKNLSLGQISEQLRHSANYNELVTNLDEKLKRVQILSKTPRQYRNKLFAHKDFDLALEKVEPLPTVTIDTIKSILEVIRDYMNECELFFKDSTTAYELFSMKADGKALISRLKKAAAYDELEKQGVIERGYWRKKSKHRAA